VIDRVQSGIIPLSHVSAKHPELFLCFATQHSTTSRPKKPAAMAKRKVGALEKVEADLTNLQNKLRRDPL